MRARALLACGAVGVPLFLLVFHVDMLTRPGFGVWRHGPSLLMTGELGLLEVINFVVTGLLMLACAAGVRRAVGSGHGATWGPRLMAGYGLAMICTGIFVTDPQLGYPPGTPQDAMPGVTAEASWHQELHTLSVFFLYAVATAACFVFARRFAAEPGGRSSAAFLVVTGTAAPVVLLAGNLVLPAVAPSADWLPALDGVLSRAIIPLGWIWAALVPTRLLLSPIQGVAPVPPATASEERR